MGGAVFLPGLLFGLGLLSAEGWGQIFTKWPCLEEFTLMIIPQTCVSKVLSPQRATVTLFSQEILQELLSGPTNPDSLEPLLCPGTQCT